MKFYTFGLIQICLDNNFKDFLAKYSIDTTRCMLKLYLLLLFIKSVKKFQIFFKRRFLARWRKQVEDADKHVMLGKSKLIHIGGKLH